MKPNGEVPERSKGLFLKSRMQQCIQGSNPCLSVLEMIEYFEKKLLSELGIPRKMSTPVARPYLTLFRKRER